MPGKATITFAPTGPMDVGDEQRVTCTFRNLAGTLTDPTTVTFMTCTPAGTETSYVYGTDAEVVKEATGVYYVDLTYSESGTWRVRWKGTGALVAAEEAIVSVRASGFATP